MDNIDLKNIIRKKDSSINEEKEEKVSTMNKVKSKIQKNYDENLKQLHRWK